MGFNHISSIESDRLQVVNKTWVQFARTSGTAVDSMLFARAKNAVDAAGYSSLEEFVTHIIEKEVVKYEQTNAEEKTAEQLRGLGYIE